MKTLEQVEPEIEPLPAGGAPGSRPISNLTDWNAPHHEVPQQIPEP